MHERKVSGSQTGSLHLLILIVLVFACLTILSAIAFVVLNTAPGIPVIHKVFTAVSLVTLTGTTFFPPSALTLTGKVLSLVITEIAAFASVFMVYWYSGYYQDGSRKKLAGSILKTFAGIQILFAVGIATVWGNKIQFSGIGERLFYSFFHSASAFCNSGFTLFDNNFASDEVFQLYVLFIGLSIPMILGGLGLPVIEDLLSIRKLRDRLADPHLDWMPVSKIVFYSSAFLIVAGAAYLFYIVPDQLIKLRLMEKGISAYFYSAGARSTGFYNIWIIDWDVVPKTFMSILMLIGGGPAGTAGGLGILFFAMILREFRTTVGNGAGFIFGSLGFVLLFIVLISVLLQLSVGMWEPSHSLPLITFDVISAFSNVGWQAFNGYSGIFENFLFALAMFTGRIFTLFIGIKTLRYWSERSASN